LAVATSGPACGGGRLRWGGECVGSWREESRGFARLVLGGGGVEWLGGFGSGGGVGGLLAEHNLGGGTTLPLS